MDDKNYKLSQLAQAHLRKIKSYSITNFSERQWLNYKQSLLAGFKMLAENPTIAKSCSDIYPNAFYFPIGKHTAYFTKEKDFIFVVAVLGQSQLPQKHLRPTLL